MSDVFEHTDEPNGATVNQQKLKRIEQAIRRRCDCSLFLTLDGITLLKDPARIREELLNVQRRLETKK